MKNTKVVVGLSGGVDSSVAAYFLKKAGYDVIGLFMKNWHDTETTISNECPWLEDSYDAMIVAEKLSIPFQTVDLSQAYKKKVVDYMFREYQAGRTPNPDVLCNREIKFDHFMKIANSLGADYVATGHYCRKSCTTDKDGNTAYQLLSGNDPTKDQSYFLCQINQKQLQKILFPIGHLKKSEVRKIATEQNFITADKKDSQGLCFVGKVHLPDFLKKRLKPQTGSVIEIGINSQVYKTQLLKNNLKELAKQIDYKPADGNVIGQHQGAYYYTIGQRKGLAIGGKVDPLFVIGIDVNQNIIYVGQGKEHPGLYRKALFINEDKIHWVRRDLTLEKNQTMHVQARIRYRQPLVKATLKKVSKGMYMVFEKPQSAVTSGQFATWYQHDELLGSGTIH